MLFFEGVETAIELQQNKRTDEIIEWLLDEVPLPPSLEDDVNGKQSAILDYLGTNLDEVVFPTVTIGRSLEAGQTILKYAADNWVKQGGSSDHLKGSYPGTLTPAQSLDAFKGKSAKSLP